MVRNGLPNNIIKIKATSRQDYIKPYTVNYVVSELSNSGYATTASSAGQRKNKEANVRTMYIGGKQKRLYQVKNYRLAFNQDNYIWNPVVAQFINFRRFDDFVTDKYRIPLGFSTRNTNLSNQIHGNYNSILNTDENIRTFLTGQNFNTLDGVWPDNIIFSRNNDGCLSTFFNKDFAIDDSTGLPILNPASDPQALPGRGLSGNLGNTIAAWVAVGAGKYNFPELWNNKPGDGSGQPSPGGLMSVTPGSFNSSSQPAANTAGTGGNVITTIDQSTRYIPIFRDTVCPFFGFKYDRSYPITQDSNVHRYIRPVWMDSWTGQLCAVFDINELPPISCGPLVSLYDNVFGKDSSALGDRTAADADSADTAAGGNATGKSNPETIPDPDLVANSPAITPELARDMNFSGTGFIITESEMRAALVGWESYLKYCLAKMPTTKPDLYLMLLSCWQNAGIQINNDITDNRRGMTAQSELENNDGHDIGQTSIAGVAGQPSKARGAQKSKVADINFSMLMHPGFIADLKIIVGFISDIASRYYGKQFMVKIPYMQSYRDQAYSSFNIPGFRNGNIFVFSGSAKILYQYDLTSSAWEEWGNYIDDSIVVGGAHWSSLTDEKGMIPPLLAFNASDKVDYVAQAWCTLSAFEKANKLSALRLQAVNFVSKELQQYSTVFDFNNEDRPLNGDLADWKLKVNCPKLIKENGEEKPNPENSCFENGYIYLDGTESDTVVRQKTNMSAQAFTAYKGFQSLKRQAKAMNSDLHATIDCTATERLVEEEDAFNKSVKFSLNEQKFLIPSIKWSTAGDSSEYVSILYNVGFLSAYDDARVDPCAGGKKLYKKASIGNNSKVAFGNPEILSDPRAILTIPNRIELNTSTYVYEHDPNVYVMPNVASEDISFYRYVKGAGNRYRVDENGEATRIEGEFGFDLTQDEYDHLEYLESNFLTPIIRGGNLLQEGSSINIATGHKKIAPKAAQPFFAAVPVISNRYVYGPWTNYPNLNKQNIWSYVQNPDTIVENLVDNLKIEQKDDLVPWHYGGTSFLDRAAIYELESQENYLTSEENGTVKIQGPPIFTVGSQFSTSANTLVSPYTVSVETINARDYNEQNLLFDGNNYTCVYLDQASSFDGYPLVQSLNISVGTDGVSTTYNIGSYNPKMGIYNKELSDAQKSANLRIIELGNRLSSLESSASNLENQDIINMREDLSRITASPTEVADFKTETMFGNSPTEMLIGQARHFIPKANGVKATDLVANKKIESWAGMFMGEEVGPELLRGYNQKAIMSMDGIFSPVSFYPTLWHSTHSMSNFETTYNLLDDTDSNKNRSIIYCHICKNARFIEDTFVDYPDSEARSKQYYPCPSCNASRVSYDKNVIKPTKDKAPRVILDPQSKKPQINFYSLNPIVVSAGEFANPNAYPSGYVANTHSIRSVGNGQSLPDGSSSLDNFKSFTSNSSVIPSQFSDYDEEAQNTEGVLMPLNQRFFGLRGPITIHGWGYDTEGYPVPNYSDEPYSVDDYGRYLRFVLDNDGFNDLTKEGKYISIDRNVRLGDIITKRYSWNGTEWERSKKPTKYFSENWASKSDTWPVGPVDLRWDHERRVWTGGNAGCGEELLPPYIVTNKIDNSTLADYIEEKTTSGCPYKMVYVTLEQDLTRSPDIYFYTNAVRGYIDDLEYISEPLPNGYRRLVYVIDRAGYTAPSGVRLLCRYNPDLGFYEPVSKPNIIALGVISGGQANINQAYAKSRSGAVATDLVVNFSNPLNFEIKSGSRGIFAFIDGEWTLTSM